MKIPYISEKRALFIVVAVMLTVLAYGLYLWPKGIGAEQLQKRMNSKTTKDSTSIVK
jgi:hypothetical protein